MHSTGLILTTVGFRLSFYLLEENQIYKMCTVDIHNVAQLHFCIHKTTFIGLKNRMKAVLKFFVYY